MNLFKTDHPEISQFDPATGLIAQEDVLRFEVPVDKTERVQMGQSATELGHHPLTTVLLHPHLKRTQGGCE